MRRLYPEGALHLYQRMVADAWTFRSVVHDWNYQRFTVYGRKCEQ